MSIFKEDELVQVTKGPLKGKVLLYMGTAEDFGHANAYVLCASMTEKFIVLAENVIKWTGSQEDAIAITPELESWFSYLMASNIQENIESGFYIVP